MLLCQFPQIALEIYALESLHDHLQGSAEPPMLVVYALQVPSFSLLKELRKIFLSLQKETPWHLLSLVGQKVNIVEQHILPRRDSGLIRCFRSARLTSFAGGSKEGQISHVWVNKAEYLSSVEVILRFKQITILH